MSVVLKDKDKDLGRVCVMTDIDLEKYEARIFEALEFIDDTHKITDFEEALSRNAANFVLKPIEFFGENPYDNPKYIFGMEPDQFIWITKSGYMGVINRAVKNGEGLGVMNGYVVIPPDHPWYEQNYEVMDVDCHGGLTYSGRFPEGYIKDVEERPFLIGYDSAHLNDFIPIQHGGLFKKILGDFPRSIPTRYHTWVDAFWQVEKIAMQVLDNATPTS